MEQILTNGKRAGGGGGDRNCTSLIFRESSWDVAFAFVLSQVSSLPRNRSAEGTLCPILTACPNAGSRL
jgi:hypothetical protein